MSTPNKVLLAVLWQRTSERGNEYLSGFLGKARVVGFRGEATPDGIQTWNLYLTPGKEQEEGRAPRRATRPRQQASAASAGAGEPFYDDPIDDIGRRGP
jgi:hypothetical protein